LPFSVFPPLRTRIVVTRVAARPSDRATRDRRDVGDRVTASDGQIMPPPFGLRRGEAQDHGGRADLAEGPVERIAAAPRSFRV